MLKDLLLVVDNGQADQLVVGAALKLAHDHGAHLSILIVAAVPVPDYSVTIFPPFVTLDQYREKTDAKKRLLSERSGAGVEVIVLSHPVQVLLDAAPVQTRYADLILFGPTASWEDGWLRRRVLENVLLESGRPVLLLPGDGTVPQFRRAVIGWNGSAEAIRAVQVAGTVLHEGAELVVATIGGDAAATGQGSEPGADLARHLRRHGFAAQAMTREAPRGMEGEALRQLAAERGADLLVLGAFARSRLRELIFGGVTMDSLEQVVVPAMLMH